VICFKLHLDSPTNTDPVPAYLSLWAYLLCFRLCYPIACMYQILQQHSTPAQQSNSSRPMPCLCTVQC
jgi:hypothetical protein